MTLALTTLSVLCQLPHGIKGDHHTGGWGQSGRLSKNQKSQNGVGNLTIKIRNLQNSIGYLQI